MSSKKDIWLSIGAGFMIMVVFCLVAWLPHHKRMSAAKAELAKVNAELQVQMSKAAILTEINNQVNEMTQVISQVDKKLVDRGELAVLLRKLSSELRRLGIENQTTHTQSPEFNADFTAIPLTISFMGQYDQADVFVRYMENLNYPIFVNRLSMQRSPRDLDKPIAVNIRMMVFFAPEGDKAS
jgi:Tfp pilus assembly protein PilO